MLLRLVGRSVRGNRGPSPSEPSVLLEMHVRHFQLSGEARRAADKRRTRAHRQLVHQMEMEIWYETFANQFQYLQKFCKATADELGDAMDAERHKCRRKDDAQTVSANERRIASLTRKRVECCITCTPCLLRAVDGKDGVESETLTNNDNKQVGVRYAENFRSQKSLKRIALNDYVSECSAVACSTFCNVCHKFLLT